MLTAFAAVSIGSLMFLGGVLVAALHADSWAVDRRPLRSHD